MDEICQIIDHTASYYHPMFAICEQCNKYNKEFERNDDY